MPPSFDLSGKVALIAGGSRGIGAAAAEALAGAGATVIVGSRKIDDCERVAAAIREKGGTARAVTLHLGELDHHDTVLSDIADSEGRLDILLNNGATNPHFGMATETPVEAWDKTIAVNVRGPYYLTTKAVPLLRADGGGSVINVASVNGLKPGMFQGIYSMTKAAIINMTQVFAQELGGLGIRVNALAPGLTDTKLASALLSNEEMAQGLMQRNISLGRAAQPDEMSGAILYLASDASSYTTGHVLTVDGGMTARGAL